MFKKFMEIHIYSEIAFNAKSAAGLDQASSLAVATKEQPKLNPVIR